MEISSWEIIANLVGLTSSIGFLPDYVALGKKDLIKLEVPNGKKTKTKKMHDDLTIPYTVYGAYPAGEELSRSMKAFLKVAQEYFMKVKA